jgi:CxxC-x17-CxxC domain-containing protein
MPLVVRDGDELQVCRDCGSDYVYSMGERRFYLSRGLSKPGRCPVCRRARRLEAEGVIHAIISCSTCGERTIVPFAPAPDRPAYCAACHRKRREEAA